MQRCLNIGRVLSMFKSLNRAWLVMLSFMVRLTIRALELNGRPFWFHEDKTFICLAKLLKLFPRLDLDHSYIEKNFKKNVALNGLKTSIVYHSRRRRRDQLFLTIDVFHLFVTIFFLNFFFFHTANMVWAKFHQFSQTYDCFVFNRTKGSNGQSKALLTVNTTQRTSFMMDKKGGRIGGDKVGDFCQEKIAKSMWWIKLRMVASEDLTSKDDLTNKALQRTLQKNINIIKKTL